MQFLGVSKVKHLSHIMLMAAILLPTNSQATDWFSARQVGLTCKRATSSPLTFQIDMFRNSWCFGTCSTAFKIEAWDARKIKLSYCAKPSDCDTMTFDRFDGAMVLTHQQRRCDVLRPGTLSALLCAERNKDEHFICTPTPFTGVNGHFPDKPRRRF